MSQPRIAREVARRRTFAIISHPGDEAELERFIRAFPHLVARDAGGVLER